MTLFAIRYPVSALLVLLGTPLAAQSSLSIYRDGRVVVRRALPQALQQGRNALTLRLEALDPATLFSTDTTVSVVTATVRYPSAKNDALARASGQTLSFVRSVGDTVKATIVRVDPPQYRLADDARAWLQLEIAPGTELEYLAAELVTEHERRMRDFDPDLLKPSFLPKLAAITLAGLRLGRGFRTVREERV